MCIPEWIQYIYVFALGSCIGSFLNVVIYRLPRNKSLSHPGSACPACNTPIRFYHNIPLISWLQLRAECPNCQKSISARYFVIEFLTGALYLGLYIIYFHTNLVQGMVGFTQGGWLIYLLHIIMLSAFIAASAIDLELWIIPLSLCWFVTGAGLIGSVCAALVLSRESILVSSGTVTASLAMGSVIGLAISLVLLKFGLIKRSYDWEEPDQTGEPQQDDVDCNHRFQAVLEVLFLGPVIICAFAAWWASGHISWFSQWLDNMLQYPVFSGLMGSIWGYFIGCAVVWGTRIFGTFGFGKEAMGLGDVHLMGAAGAVLGAKMTAMAFFIAPFFGLGWALFQMFFKKTRQIPYGPFLSLGTLTVMIFYGWILHKLFGPVL